MTTNVIMKRPILNSEISQRSDNGFLSLTDLLNVGILWRAENNMNKFNIDTYLSLKSTKEFMEELKKSFGEVKINSKGKGHHTWIHPYLFIDIALNISPTLKITIYSWIYDNLIKYRNDSGDSYKKMCGALYLTIENKSNFSKEIVDIANRIRIFCDVIDWQEASEYQLKLRDKIHEYIALFSDIIRERENLLDIAFKKAKEKQDSMNNEIVKKV